MYKKEAKNEKETEVRTPKRTVRKNSAVKAEDKAPAKKAVVAAEKSSWKVAQKVAEKNAKTEGVEEDKKYFAKWTEKDFKRTGEEAWFYRVSLVAATLGMLWAAYDRNFLTFFTFFILTVVILLELRWESRDVEYEVNMDGIFIAGKSYRFEEIKSFEITKKGDCDVVKFQLKNSIFPVKEMYLNAAEQDLPFMRALLKHFLPEETQEEKLFNFTKAEKKLTEEEYIDKKVNEYLKGKI